MPVLAIGNANIQKFRKNSTMPVRKEIRQNETVEIRCTLIETGNFADNRYTIRYFQSEGYGELRLGKDGKVFLPNTHKRTV